MKNIRDPVTAADLKHLRPGISSEVLKFGDFFMHQYVDIFGIRRTVVRAHFSENDKMNKKLS